MTYINHHSTLLPYCSTALHLTFFISNLNDIIIPLPYLDQRSVIFEVYCRRFRRTCFMSVFTSNDRGYFVSSTTSTFLILFISGINTLSFSFKPGRSLAPILASKFFLFQCSKILTHRLS